MVQTVCYVPTHGTTRNSTITHCTAWYYTKYTRYHVGLLRYIRYHDVIPRYKRCVTYPHKVQREITPLRTAGRGNTQSTRGTTSDYSGTYGTKMKYKGTYGTKCVLRTDTRYNANLHHYALYGGVLHKVHAVPHRTTQVHTVP